MPASDSCSTRNAASARRATSFSMPTTTMWQRGSDETSRPLPSFSSTTSVPVSAIRKFAPVMPIPASRNVERSCERAQATIVAGSSPISSPASCESTSATSWRSMWTIGARMWEGRCPRAGRPTRRGPLDRADAAVLERLVQADLLRNHRLALGHQRGAPPPGDGEHCGRRVLGRRGAHERAPVRAQPALVGVEQLVEAPGRVAADAACAGDALVPVGVARADAEVRVAHRPPRRLERPCEVRAGEGLVEPLVEPCVAGEDGAALTARSPRGRGTRRGSSSRARCPRRRRSPRRAAGIPGRSRRARARPTRRPRAPCRGPSRRTPAGT